MIKLVYSGDMAELTRRSGESIDAARLRDVFRYIKKTYGAECAVAARRALVTVDGVRCYVPSAVIPDKSEVKFYPFCTGG